MFALVSVRSWRDAPFRRISRRWGGRGLSIAIGLQENIFQRSLVGWPEQAQQRRFMPVTTGLRHWIEAVHFVGKTNRSPSCSLKQLRSDPPLLSKPFFTFKLGFHPHTGRFRQHSMGNRRLVTTRVVEIDWSIKSRDCRLPKLEQWAIALVNFSVTWHLTSERVCWMI